MHPHQINAFHRRLQGVEQAVAHQGAHAAQIQEDLRQWTLGQKIRKSQGGLGNQFDLINARRIPWMEKIEIDFEYHDNRTAEGSVTIPIDGAAVFEHVAAFYRSTDTTNAHFSSGTAAEWTGRPLPVSGYQAFARSPVLAAAPSMSLLVDIPEIDLQFISASTGKNWSNLAIPGGMYDDVDKHPVVPYGYANAQEALTVRAQTRRAIPHDGTLEVVFYGYQLLGVLNLTEALNEAMAGVGATPGLRNG